MILSTQGRILRLVVLFVFVSLATAIVFAQGLGAGTVEVTVVDPNGAVVPNASVTISNPVTGYTRTAVTAQDGVLRFDNVPPNNYQVSISATGFAPATQTVSVRTSVPITLKMPLSVGATAESVTITGGTAELCDLQPALPPRSIRELQMVPHWAK